MTRVPPRLGSVASLQAPATTPLSQSEASVKGPKDGFEHTSTPRAPSSAGGDRMITDGLRSRLTGRLTGLATRDPKAFGKLLDQAFGSRLDAESRTKLIADAQAGKLSLPANVEFVDASVLGGRRAAYSGADGGRIFINKDLKLDAKALSAAFAHEVGHHIDRQLGAGDARGDEGAIFARGLSRGGPIAKSEASALHRERDAGVLMIDGKKVPVEFSDSGTIAEAYETKGAFSQAALQTAGADALSSQVDRSLITKHSATDPAIKTIEDVKTHLEAKKIDFATERNVAENALLRPHDGAVTDKTVDDAMIAKFKGKTVGDKKVETLDDVKAYLKAEGVAWATERAAVENASLSEAKTTFVGTFGKKAAADALGATIIVKLKAGGVLDEMVKLKTTLPSKVQSRVDADPKLGAASPKIKSYGQLVAALTRDVDTNGRPDIDALQLARFFPDAPQQKLLKSLQADLSTSELTEKLRGVGFENAIVQHSDAAKALSFAAPSAFGLNGKTAIEKQQQQFVLRTGQIFVDANADGKVDDTDLVKYVDPTGTIRETQYKDINADLKVLVRYNLATAAACEEYASQPSYKRMKFPHYNSSTGEGGKEAVNETFWTVSTATKNRNQISWELKPGKTPAEGILDALEDNGAKYTTECAHGRTLLRLKGLLKFKQAEFGEAEGLFRFNATFAKDSTNKKTATEYLAKFETYKNDNPGKGWADYTTANAAPTLEYAIEVSRHYVLGNNEQVLQPWKTASGESAAGNNGYFHNYSVSVLGVRIGYVGENVIDLGYKDGARRYWGHPGGIQNEGKWQHELASGDIPVSKMADYGQYFATIDQQRNSTRFTKERLEKINEEITKLKADKPSGWEKQVETKENSIAFYNVLDGTRQALADGFEKTQWETAKKFYATTSSISKPEQMQALADTLTPDAKAKLTKTFDALDTKSKEGFVKHFAVADESKLTDGQKANAALYVGLIHGGSLHSVLRKEGQQALDNAAFAEWVNGSAPLSSRSAFTTWLASPEFKTFYKDKTGTEYSGKTDVVDMSTDEVQKLVELAAPMTRNMRTIYAQVNRGQQMLSRQMATFLKEGKLPHSEYKPAPTATPND